MAFDNDRSSRAILDELETHPHAARLSELVHALAVTAFDERRTSLDEGLDEAATRLAVDDAGAETSFGNVLRAIRKRDGATGPERTLLGALVARGSAASLTALPSPPAAPPEVTGPAPSVPGEGTTAAADRRAAEALSWISAHTVADALSAAEIALGPRARGVFEALGHLIRGYDEGKPGSLDRASVILAALAVSHSSGPGRDVRRALGVGIADPVLVALLAPVAAPRGENLVLSAEVAPAPRGPVLTFLLICTFILPVIALLRMFARFALRLRRPAEVAFSKDGVTVKSRLEMLGKTLREREVFFASSGLVRAAREVRYPRAATYLGIACLLVGSYLGLRLVLDGIRAGSPEYLGLGLAIMLGGLAIDYALTLLPERNPSRCRIFLEPKRGSILALSRVDRGEAEAALKTLKA